MLFENIIFKVFGVSKDDSILSRSPIQVAEFSSGGTLFERVLYSRKSFIKILN